ncbi:MAG: helix-turn-helix domain-containing protein [Bacteroides sp.]|nr:helix-turn-helix domain-containing protein [Bacteroides sp.]
MEGWERIQYIMDQEGLNKNSLSRAMGMTSNVTITRIINEKRSPSRTTSERVIKAFPKYSFNWLYRGKGEILSDPRTYEAWAVPEKNEGEFLVENSNGARFYDLGNGKYRMNVPLVPFFAYGRFTNEDCSLQADRDEWETEDFEVNQLAHGKYMSFEVRGDSMDDGTRESFEQGDKLLARELDRIYWKDKLRYNKYPYWVIVFDSSVLIKQIIDQNLETGEITCHSLNKSPEYHDFTLKLDDVRMLFNVIKKKPKQVDY